MSVEQTLFPAGIELICGGGDVKQVTSFGPFALPSNQFSQFDFDFSKQLEINTGQLIFGSTSICHLHQGYQLTTEAISKSFSVFVICD